MSATQAFAISLSLAFAVLAVAYASIWRTMRAGCWAGFSATAGLAAIYFLIEQFMPVVDNRPHFVATALGCSLMMLGWLSVGSYLGLSRRALQIMSSIQVAQGLVVATLVGTGAMSRIGVFSNYAVMAWTVLITTWRTGDGSHRQSQVLMACVAVLYPTAVGLAVAGVLAPLYLRYAMAMPMVMVGMAMLVEGMLTGQRQSQDAVQQMQTAQQQLRSMVLALADGSGQVAASGKTMSEGAQMLAMRTDEQTGHIRDTADAVRSVAAQVSLTSSHVNEVDLTCRALEQQAGQGGHEVEDTVASIQRIDQRTNEMDSAIVMIESIAFQTNLLSLNAAIEAARAGSAGRGFAVVAGEVRMLSTRTRDAASQVRALIERARQQSGEGVQRVLHVRDTLAQMTGAVQEVAAHMRDVAADATKQRQSLDGVLAHLDELTKLTDANANMVAQSVMASDDMNASAQRLTEIVALAGSDGLTARSPSEPLPQQKQQQQAVEFF